MNVITRRTANSQRLLLSMLHVIADALGKLWASPFTAVGLVYGLSAHAISMMLGVQSSMRFGNNAIQFIDCSGVLKSRAITLGNVILYGSDAEPWRYGAYGDASVNLGRHEQAHTYQYQLLGPLFVLVYCLCGGAAPDKNPLERAAQNFGARRGDWWR